MPVVAESSVSPTGKRNGRFGRPFGDECTGFEAAEMLASFLSVTFAPALPNNYRSSVKHRSRRSAYANHDTLKLAFVVSFSRPILQALPQDVLRRKSVCVCARSLVAH
jgi:hypothetical protein